MNKEPSGCFKKFQTLLNSHECLWMLSLLRWNFSRDVIPSMKLLHPSLTQDSPQNCFLKFLWPLLSPQAMLWAMPVVPQSPELSHFASSIFETLREGMGPKYSKANKMETAGQWQKPKCVPMLPTNGKTQVSPPLGLPCENNGSMESRP